ncbi:MAG: DUF1802 family protein [Chthoniobacterales bacterium]|nr:DUF1802 family protein [Chthoniobacterales bacterium]
MESIGFKEWALVCQALGSGEQNVILRKGGLAEGRAGFAFRHPEFFLFPTFFHAQTEMLRLAQSEPPTASSETVGIRFFAKVDDAQLVTEWQTAEALTPFHVLKPEVVRERFEYDDARGVHVAFVRVFRLAPGWNFPDEPRFGGCRSWVKLPQLPAGVVMQPVISDEEHGNRLSRFRAVIAAQN